MVDTPDPEDYTRDSEGELEGPGAFPHPTHTTETHYRHEKPNYYSKGTEYGMRALKAVWRVFLKTANWIDSKGPLISALSTVVIAVLTAFYVHYSRVANGINQQSANAATSAACTATRSLELTRQMFEASQAAVFVSAFELKTRPEHHPVWITVRLRNTGKTRATNMVGTIKLVRKTTSGKMIQNSVRTFTRSIIAAEDEITEALGVNGTWDNLRGYLGEDFQVSVELVFDDGVQRTKQTFCRGPVMQNGTDTGTSFAFTFEDCENIKARKQYGY